MGTGTVVLMTDHGSGQRSRVPMENAVELLTWASPLSIDARHFMFGCGGRVPAGTGCGHADERVTLQLRRFDIGYPFGASTSLHPQ